LEPREPLAKNAIDIEVEDDARRCFEQCVQRAFVTHRSKPAPVAEQVNIAALAGQTGFPDGNNPVIRPPLKRVRRERLAKPLVVSLRRLCADAGARAPFDLPRKAWTRAALEAEQAPAAAPPDPFESAGTVDPLRVEVGYALVSIVDEKMFQISLSQAFMKVAEHVRPWVAIGFEEWIQAGRWWLMKVR